MPYPSSTQARTTITPRNLRENLTKAWSIYANSPPLFVLVSSGLLPWRSLSHPTSTFGFSFCLLSFALFGEQLLSTHRDHLVLGFQLSANKPAVLERIVERDFSALKGCG